MSTASLRTLGGLTRRVRVPARAFTTTARQFEAATQNSVPVEAEVDSKAISQQAPNRVGIWARGQRARTQAMTGPRFEQTDFAVQVSGGNRAGDSGGRPIERGREDRRLPEI